MSKSKSLETQKCAFSNLPDKQVGAWGQGLTAEKMKNFTGSNQRLLLRLSSQSGHKMSVCGVLHLLVCERTRMLGRL
jgi:hypothetical protein